jgi:hypothetical protein
MFQLHSLALATGFGLLLYGAMSTIICLAERLDRENYIPPVFGWFRFIISLAVALLILAH